MTPIEWIIAAGVFGALALGWGMIPARKGEKVYPVMMHVYFQILMFWSMWKFGGVLPS